MFMLMVTALALLFSGLTFLQSALNAREHTVWFILFWAICAWLTLTALLLAIFDVLILKAGTRKAQRELRERLKSNSPTSTIDE